MIAVIPFCTIGCENKNGFEQLAEYLKDNYYSATFTNGGLKYLQYIDEIEDVDYTFTVNIQYFDYDIPYFRIASIFSYGDGEYLEFMSCDIYNSYEEHTVTRQRIYIEDSSYGYEVATFSIYPITFTENFIPEYNVHYGGDMYDDMESDSLGIISLISYFQSFLKETIDIEIAKFGFLQLKQ